MSRKYLLFMGMIILVLPLLQGCILDGNTIYKGTGIIKYMSLEGGFYGIISDTGEHLDPNNLPKQFQIDGLRVNFIVEEADGQASFHYWGIIVNIVKIEKESYGGD
jgi:hypothetical protein